MNAKMKSETIQRTSSPTLRPPPGERESEPS
jgi:hypothetical protein